MSEPQLLVAPSQAALTLRSYLGRALATLVRRCFDLPARQRLVLWLSRLPLLSRDLKAAIGLLLLHDLAEIDGKRFHKYLWANHAAYACNWETGRLEAAIEPSRQLFFKDLADVLRQQGWARESISSVLEAGSSLGFNLRYLESFFPMATTLWGIDIDRYAVEQGVKWLAREGSRVQLKCGDMEDLNELVQEQMFDLVFCCGVLLYLDEQTAQRAVAAMLRHTRKIAGFAALPNPHGDNRDMTESTRRRWDGGYIHNVDRMVSASGGTILGRRYRSESESVYFTFALPPVEDNRCCSPTGSSVLGAAT